MARAGEVILVERLPARSLMIVGSGAIALAVTGPHGRRSVVEVIGPGDPFGEEALAEQEAPGSFNRPVRPEARALTRSTVFVFTVRDQEHLMDDPAGAAWFAGALARRLGRVQAALSLALSPGVEERIVRVLAALADRWGRSADGGTVIELPLSQDGLASMVGATRETVNRALRRLRADGTVSRRGRRYVLAVSSAPPSLA